MSRYPFQNAMLPKLKVAVTPWVIGAGGTAQAFAEQAEIAEHLGFHSFWLPESHFSGNSSIPAPLMLLAAAASRTSQIGLGTTSYLLPIRHPILAAEEVAVLDRLSGGRVILGVGRGFRGATFTTFDVPVKEKRELFATALEAMILAWRGEPIAWQEEIQGAKTPVYLAPQPVQTPHPPIWAAAFGPLALKQAGTLGLPYLASPLETKNELEANYSRHQEFWEEAGHPPLTTIPLMRTIFISRNPHLLKQVRQSLVRPSRTPQQKKEVAVDDWALVGEPNFVAEAIAQYQEQLGMTHLITRLRIEDVAPSALRHSLEILAEMSQTEF